MSVSVLGIKLPKKSIFSGPRHSREYFIERLFVTQPGDGFLYTPIFLACGIGLYFSLPAEPVLWVSILSFLFFFAVTVSVYIRSPQTGIYKAGTVLLFAGTLICAGLSAAQIRTIYVDAPVLTQELAQVSVIGTVYALDPLPDEGGGRLWLKNLEIEDLDERQTPYMVRIRVRESNGILPGQKVRVLAGLNPPGSPVVPGGFDFQRHAYFKRLGGVGFAYGAPEILDDKPSSSFDGLLERARLHIISRIKISVSSELKGVVTTFMTGEKTSIEDDELTAMRESGLAHLLAISGLHVGLIATIIFFFSRIVMASVPRFALWHPIKKYAAGIALVAAFFYMLLVGSTVPTQRAMLMTGVALIAIMLDRSPFSLRMVALAACLVLITMPESLLSASFQMSFSAVTVLVWAYDRLRPAYSRLAQDRGIIRRILLYVGGIAFTSVLAGFATMPFALYHFQQWSVYGVLANILAMPVMGIWVMPLAVLSYLGMCIGFSHYPLILMAEGVEWILDVAHYVSALEGAVIHLPVFSHIAFVLFVSAGLLMMIGPIFARMIAGIMFISALFFPANLPHILISDNSKLVGYYDRDTETLYVSSLQYERYNREQWTRSLGSPEVKKWPEVEDLGNIRCDEAACRIADKGLRISFPKTPYVFQSECKWADIIVLTTPPSLRCAKNDHVKVIDRLTTYYNGSTAVYRSGSGTYEMRTNKEARGDRMWVQ